MKIEYVKFDKNQSMDDLLPAIDLLPEERRKKIARYRFEGDKIRSLIAGLLIRRATGGVPLTYGPHAKPYADGVYFSVSHSGEIVAIVTDDHEVGLDVEQFPTEDKLKIADRFYHPAEREEVNASDDRQCAFCRIWTRKEAYLKMTGEGISTDLTAFDTTSAPLQEQLFTVVLDGCCLSVCSDRQIDADTVFISNIELKSLLP